jgi:hypothetical protein
MLGFLVIVASSAFTLAKGPFNMTPTPISGLEELATKTHLTFPAGARVIEGSICHCWEAHAYAKIRISPKDIEPFLGQPPFQGRMSGADFTLDPIFASARLSERWQLSRIKRSTFVEGGDRYQLGQYQALVDLDSPESPILYVFWNHD